MNMTYSIPYYSLEKIHQDLKKELMEGFRDVLEDNWFILGKYLERFEETFAEYLGVKYAIGVGNGMDGLKIALRSLQLTKKDEILIPALTFSASILAALETGIHPVLVDIDPTSYLIDPNQAEQKLNVHSRAIMPVHLYGYPCDMDHILRLAELANLYVIEDYAQSVGARYHGQHTGSIGIINATSFYPVKTLGSLGDGGMVTTNDPELRNLCIQYRNYGYKEKYQLESTGYNSRLDEIQAAFLLIKLRSIEKWQQERQQIADRYLQNLSGIDQILLPTPVIYTKPAHHIFPIRIPVRDELKSYLADKGIETQIHYPIPPHLQRGLQFLGYKYGDLPETEEFCRTELSLPLYPGLSTQQVDLICEHIRFFIKGRDSISKN